MKFQTVVNDGPRKHPFKQGYFYDENGPYIESMGGWMEHLSKNFFCQEDALVFVQEVLTAGKITLEEACAFGRDPALLSLPEKRPSNLTLWQKNEMAHIAKLGLTMNGKKKVTDLLVADSDATRYALKSFLSKIFGGFGLRIFLFFKKTPRETAKEQMRDIQRKAKKNRAKKQVKHA